jgi:exopolysaccharide biosynthesis polyprenyl glycosylphosphotransferase
MERELTRRGREHRKVEILEKAPGGNGRNGGNGKAMLEVPALTDEELESLLTQERPPAADALLRRRGEVALRVGARVLSDLGAVAGATSLAYWLRYSHPWVRSLFPPENVPPFGVLLASLLVMSPLLLLSLKSVGMYDVRDFVKVLDRVPRILGAVNAYVVCLLVVSFLLDTSVLDRGFLAFFWSSLIFFVFAGRLFLQLVAKATGLGDVMQRNTLIVGAGNVGRELARKLVRHRCFGLKPVGFLDDDPLYTSFEEGELGGLRVLGKLDDLPAVIHEFNVEKVIIAFSNCDAQQLLDLASRCNRMGVECSIIPRLFEVITNEILVSEIGGIPLIKLREKKLGGYKRVLKAVEDYVLAILLLLLIWPLLLVTAIAIKLDSPGPVFFKHRRVGKDGKHFNCLKFRSMVDGAHAMQEELVKTHRGEHGWLCWKVKEDPRVTRVGRWIRKFSIDELPQLFNVLAGQMSLVGPRPHIQEEVDQYKDWHRQRLNVKPGITGLWQVSGRSNLPFDEMIKLDLYYIEKWSLWLDLKIILRTVLAVFTSNGAY